VNKLVLLVHGGAGNLPRDSAEARRNGLRRALDQGWKVLHDGGSSLDACEKAIIELEDDPVFDAGIGSHLNRDGKVQLDAILMDGATLKSGAVAAVERIRNPIRLARLILDFAPHMLLAGYGAEMFAGENGMELCNPEDLIVEREAKLWAERASAVSRFGTVGAVALDASGNLASGTSTGGTVFKYPGRVGDSPLVGCGCYADNQGAAISTTGEGEPIMRVVMAKTVNDFVTNGLPPQKAAEAALEVLRRRTGGHAGLIVLDQQGRLGSAFSTPYMSFAYRTSDSDASTISA
jgi:beta-aspartyl-peptidase (threonine type)